MSNSHRNTMLTRKERLNLLTFLSELIVHMRSDLAVNDDPDEANVNYARICSILGRLIESDLDLSDDVPDPPDGGR